MKTEHDTVETLIYLAGVGTASSVGYNQDTDNIAATRDNAGLWSRCWAAFSRLRTDSSTISRMR